MDTQTYTEPSTAPYAPAVDLGKPVRLRGEQVYTELRRRVMLGDFGIQTRLVEERLATELGVSRTPIREALVRLVADNLVVRRPDGYYVALPDLTQLRNLYELRITLELRGLTRAIEPGIVRHDRELLEPLLDQWRGFARDLPEADPMFVLLDEDFHVTLSRASGNVELTACLSAVNARIRAVRMYDFLTTDRIERTVAEHTKVLELVLADELDEALTSLHKHVGISMEVVERRAAQAISHMAMNRGSR
jgi:DNA-binding GntR family transcriptional regulator